MPVFLQPIQKNGRSKTLTIDCTAEIAIEFSFEPGAVSRTIALLDDDATVPFIARYRKEATGELDEEQIRQIRDRLAFLRELDKRKQTVLETIEKQGKLTDDLKQKILDTRESTVLEDLYLPYKPKRKTRATDAIEKGLEPLADLIWNQQPIEGDPNTIASGFVSEEKGVPDLDAAWNGAKDIIAERVSENTALRPEMRKLFAMTGIVSSKVKKNKEKEGANFRDYFDYSEPAATIPSHRMLAVRRGEAEGFLTLRITVDKDRAYDICKKEIIKGDGGPLKFMLTEAIEDSFDRLLSSSIEGHTRNELRKRADQQAVNIFATNLRQLLMASPLGGKWILGVDPGIRTGSKIVALDGKGDLLASTVIYVGRSSKESKDAEKIVETYCRRYRIEAIAIGNGTGGREMEIFFRSLERDTINDAHIVMVNESGASVYSASDIARKEFPDLDITFRGAVSIGRRLQDPLAELVKIEPKSIGVGQYQHDVDQALLKESLDEAVISCVNAVGVDLNLASPQLLNYVSGLNATQAQAVIDFRSKKGAFKSRSQLTEVPKIGPKTYEQAAGFLRIVNGDNLLDASAVHPERYELVEQMARDLNCDVPTLIQNKELRESIDISKYVSDQVGEPTLRDILAELDKPGRDPRATFKPVEFNPEVMEIKDLKEGMVLEGVITNVTNFGAFVDIGVHQDGLVHVSELSHNFITDPSEVAEVGKQVKVKVIEVDKDRRRISLSIKQTTTPPPRPVAPPQPERRDKPHQSQKGRPKYQGKPQQQKGSKSSSPPAYTPFANLFLENGKVKLKKD